MVGPADDKHRHYNKKIADHKGRHYRNKMGKRCLPSYANDWASKLALHQAGSSRRRRSFNREMGRTSAVCASATLESASMTCASNCTSAPALISSSASACESASRCARLEVSATYVS